MFDLPALKSYVSEVLFEIRVMFRKKDFGSKVFCIGYQKTGTTSLGKAFEQLGYRNSSFNKKVWRKYYKKGNISKVIDYTSKFDSFDDLPWLKTDMIPILDEKFPNSKFVYLERDEVEWKDSMKRWHLYRNKKEVDVNIAWSGYLEHQRFVKHYFNDKPNKILALTIKDVDGMKKLAEFLGKKPSNMNFPHYNKNQSIKSSQF